MQAIPQVQLFSLIYKDVLKIELIREQQIVEKIEKGHDQVRKPPSPLITWNDVQHHPQWKKYKLTCNELSFSHLSSW